MTNFTYTKNIPFGPNNPSVDQPKMLDNTNSTADLINVDHVGFGQNNGGYHTIIHQGVQSGHPAQIAGIGQLYILNQTVTNSAGSTTDTQLFFKSGGNVIGQLTGQSASTNGYQRIGGLLFQWGVIAPSSNVNNDVVFNTTPNQNFPTACWNVQFSPQRVTADPGSSYEFYVDNTTVSTTGFRIINRSGHTYGYYWIALGN